jgi:hypothetical protein
MQAPDIWQALIKALNRLAIYSSRTSIRFKALLRFPCQALGNIKRFR